MASVQPLPFGDLLKRYRVAARLTQEELAEQARLSARAIRALETGARRTPRKDTVAMLANALGLSTSERAMLESAARTRGVPPLADLPVHPYQAQGNRQTLPLIGRAQELQLIQLSLTEDGPPMALLAGEPGIGKSRLLHEVATRAHEAGWVVLRGGCTRRSGQEPFSPWQTALAGFIAARSPVRLGIDLEGCAWLVRLLPELAERGVTPVPNWTLPADQERRLMFAAVARMLNHVAGPAGTLVLLDDMQWAGPDALDLLGFLASTAVGEPSSPPSPRVRFVGVYRSTEVTPATPLGTLISDLARDNVAGIVPLAPLTPSETRDLLTTMLNLANDRGVASDQTAHERWMAQALERIGGVPFFAVSYAQAVTSHDPNTGSDLPWTVRQSVLQRIAGLPRTAQQMLGVAAVAGREIPGAELLAAAGKALAVDRVTVVEAIEAACASGLLVEGERGDYRFAHDLIREATLDSLSAARRAMWHHIWAQTIERLLEQRGSGERPTRAAELAWHWTRAGEARRAAPYALAAGDQATAIQARGEAEQRYAEAAELARASGDATLEAVALEKLGDSLYLSGRHADARAALDRAAHLYRDAGDTERSTWLTIQFIRACLDGGDPGQQGFNRLRALLRELATLHERAQWEPDTDPLRTVAGLSLARLTPSTAARVCIVSAICCSGLGCLHDALAAAKRAVSFAREAQERWIEATAYMIEGHVLTRDGRWDDALSAFREATQLAEEVGYLDTLQRALTNTAEVQTARGASEDALAVSARALAAGEELDAPISIASGLESVARVLTLVGRWREAREHLQRASALLATLPPTTYTALVVAGNAWLALLLGDPAADALLEEALALAERFATPDVVLNAHAALAERNLLAGNVSVAAEHLSSLLAVSLGDATYPQDISRMTALPLMAWAEAEQGNDDKFTFLLNDDIQGARALGARPALAEALRVQARLAIKRARWAEAEQALAEALALCETIPYPYVEAKVRYEQARLALARGDADVARASAEAALVLLDRLGERIYASHIEVWLCRLDHA